MNNTRLLAVINDYFKKTPPPFFAFDYGDNIPFSKLKNARKLYADFNLIEEQPLLLIDDTIFRSAKLGLLITNTSMYFRLRREFNKWEIKVNNILLKDLMELLIKTNNRGAYLFVNGDKVGCFRVLEAWGSKQKEANVLNELFEILIKAIQANKEGLIL